ncbi:hypothetical protein OROMI_002897 [Orobanche minor]
MSSSSFGLVMFLDDRSLSKQTNLGWLIETHGRMILGEAYEDPIASFRHFQSFSVQHPEACCPENKDDSLAIVWREKGHDDLDVNQMTLKELRQQVMNHRCNTCSLPWISSRAEFWEDVGVTILGTIPSLVKTWKITQCMDGLNWTKL